MCILFLAQYRNQAALFKMELALRNRPLFIVCSARGWSADLLHASTGSHVFDFCRISTFFCWHLMMKNVFVLSYYYYIFYLIFSCVLYLTCFHTQWNRMYGHYVCYFSFVSFIQHFYLCNNTETTAVSTLLSLLHQNTYFINLVDHLTIQLFPKLNYLKWTCYTANR